MKSKYVKNDDEVLVEDKVEESKKSIKFTIADTEYLLRKLMDAKIDGREVKQASKTFEKIEDLHQQLMEQGIEINSR